MKLTLFAACLAAVFAATAALECWKTGAKKPCTVKGSQDVDTNTCVKKLCPNTTGTTYACVRTTRMDTTTTTLEGCKPNASAMACTESIVKISGKETTAEKCYCDDKDFCNGAVMGVASMTAIILALVSFVAVFIH